MAEVTASMVSQLRQRTGAGMMDCKKALVACEGDMERAADELRKSGIAKAASKSDRLAKEGLIRIVKTDDRHGVLLVLNCETDFVARNDDFREFARDVALHVAAANPQYVSEDEVPEEARQAEARIFEEQAQDKPEQARPKIVEGRLQKWLTEIVLLKQEHVNKDKHGGQTIEELRAATAAKTGENVVIRRFARFQVGEAV